MKKSGKKVQSLSVKSGLKGGRIALNHGKAGLKVKSALKSGRISLNHSISGLGLK